MDAKISEGGKSAKELLGRIRGFRETALKLNTEAKNLAIELHRLIENGESTGDGVIDFVIFKHGDVIEEFVKIYQSFKDRIKKHLNEPILLVFKKDEYFGPLEMIPPKIPHGGNYFVKGNLYLGVIKSEMTFYAAGECNFPTEMYTQLTRGNYGTIPGNLPLKQAPYDYDLLDLNRKIERSVFEDEPDIKLQVLIGNEEVGRWFKENAESPSAIGIFGEIKGFLMYSKLEFATPEKLAEIS